MANNVDIVNSGLKTQIVPHVLTETISVIDLKENLSDEDNTVEDKSLLDSIFGIQKIDFLN